MAERRIAVLFDAENINCQIAERVLTRLASRGTVQIRRAVGNLATLSAWTDCAKAHGVELVLQPCLGKGKNGADIRLTIEAMDIVHDRRVDTVALVTRDRDFTPLALRLRGAGLDVWGFAPDEPNAVFAAACTQFEVIATPALRPTPANAVSLPKPVPAKAAPPPVVGVPKFSKAELARLAAVVAEVSRNGPVAPAALCKAIVEAEPDLATRLSGSGRFLKWLVALRLVKRVGSGPTLLVRAQEKQAA